MIILPILIIFIFAILYISYTKKGVNQRNEYIRQERAVNGDFKSEHKNTYVSSILTGVPVQTRYGGGGLTGAGAQEQGWCYQILQDMGKKKTIIVNTMWGKQKYTRKQIEEHLASI